MELNSILLIAANPHSSHPDANDYLRLQEEEREIKECLRKARSNAVVHSVVAARPRDINPAISEYKPQVVHFSGHSTPDGYLVLEDEIGKEKFVSSKALANSFGLFRSYIKCVVINACESMPQAQEISHLIDYVIVMNGTIGDDAAIKFSRGFYTALGSGNSFEFAFRSGISEIRMEGIAGYSIPVIFRNGKQITGEELLCEQPTDRIYITENEGKEHSSDHDYGFQDNVNFHRVFGFNTSPRLQRAIYNFFLLATGIKPGWFKECYESFLTVDRITGNLAVIYPPDEQRSYCFWSFYLKLSFISFVFFMLCMFLLHNQKLFWGSLLLAILSLLFCFLNAYLMRPYTLATKIENELKEVYPTETL